MQANFYKLSLSWPRIVPTGRASDGFSLAGLDHYNKVIDNLLANGITPFVTLHQWDIPQPLVDSGSWLNETIVDHFSDYARIVFSALGSKVTLWATIHEPYVSVQAEATFGEHNAFQDRPVKPYIAAHNMLKAHTSAYRIYHDELKLGGQVGLTLNSEWTEPQNATNPEHVQASDRALQFRVC